MVKKTSRNTYWLKLYIKSSGVTHVLIKREFVPLLKVYVSSQENTPGYFHDK